MYDIEKAEITMPSAVPAAGGCSVLVITMRNITIAIAMPDKK